ncbi:MAG: ABC transporter permease [Anaerolineaceae bacterium]|nr:ABC transporter permease [Anaerolineaceae bacterium]
MLKWIWIFGVRQPQRSVLLCVGLFILSAGALLVAALSSSSVVQVEEDLSHYWRTSYDILVRPPGIRSPIEQKYNLVEANYLTGINGGITFSQYEAIREIQTVETAAPIAILGYLPMELSEEWLRLPATSGIFAYETTIRVDRGSTVWEKSQQYYGYSGTVASKAASQRIPGLFINQPSLVLTHQSLPFMLAAIDPGQEAMLVGLERALVQGIYLTGEERLLTESVAGPQGGMGKRVFDVPVLVNKTPYVKFTSTIRIKQLKAPGDGIDLDTIIKNGGARYLNTLPGGVVLAEQTISSAEAYTNIIRSLSVPGQNGVVRFRSLDEYRRPGARKYHEIPSPIGNTDLVLEALTPETWQGNKGSDQSTGFTLKAVGTFDADLLPAPGEINRVPLETYFPPVATIRYDENGQPVHPNVVLPTIWPEYSVPSPPLMLTSLEAARAIAGDKCISAIRVRVGGIDSLSREAQQKIEATATEIRRRTGLEVDVLVGSSPTTVLIKEPGLGYVDEGWIQKGLVFSFRNKVQSGHLLLLVSVFAIAGIFVLDLTWADLLANQRLLALQIVIGWRERARLVQVVGRTLVIGAIASGLGCLAARELSVIFQWTTPTARIFIVIWVACMILSLVGSFIPAWIMRETPPITRLVPGGGNHFYARERLVRSILHYAWHGLLRRWERTALGVLSGILSSLMLVLFLLITVEQRGYMAGSLLGRYIAANVEGYHYVLIGVGFGLTALSLGNSLLAGILERRNEMGVLKTLGWRSSDIVRLFLGEGVALGGIGGLAGSLVAISVFWGLYHALSASLFWIIPVGVGVTGLVGMVAALYPARLASRATPAETLRSE